MGNNGGKVHLLSLAKNKDTLIQKINDHTIILPSLLEGWKARCWKVIVDQGEENSLPKASYLTF